MGIGTRIFLVDENDFLHRISISRYNRLTKPDSDERFTQYAGKRDTMCHDISGGGK